MCVCGTRKSARSLFYFIQVFYIYLFKFNIPHKSLSALNFSVGDISFTREKNKSAEEI